MGVPKFFRYISERYPCLSELVKEYQIPEFDNLYLDMNGIIHTCSHPDDGNPHFRITEEKIFQDIFHYIEVLFRMIRPQKLFFMAVDGVAPRAKMNQQRGRRFRTAKDVEKQETNAVKKGEKLPEAARFDSNCITPGTVFMARLHEQLKYFVIEKISHDPLWQKCKIILSGHETPGEGEHKIMDYIRYMRTQPGYDPNTRHCLYGLDADLIMLGLCTHEPHFSLLREEVKFGRKSTKKITLPEEIKFYLLHLSLMREYIELEFAPLKDKLQGFPYDFEKVIDDWVLMGFLVGNDFIPHLPNLHITNGALPVLYKAYMDALPTLDGYINEAGTLNLARFEKFMEKLSCIDIENFEEIRDDLLYMEAKTGKKFSAHTKVSTKNLDDSVTEEVVPEKAKDSGLAALIQATDEMVLETCEDVEEQSDEDDAFKNYKEDYYRNKLEYSLVTPEVMRDQAEGYVRAIQWNLNYYYNGCCSWSWYYPHHYAPYISDIKGFSDLKITFDLGKPFLPYEQLLAVLPAACMNLLPECYHHLITDEYSPIKKYYPEEFQTDLNGKKQEWEAVVLVPFIDENVLLDVMAPFNEQLTPEEKERNKHGPMFVYTYTPQDMGSYFAPCYFPAVPHTHAEVTAVSYQDIRVPKDRLVKGAYPGVRMNVYYPGFPTMKHLKYKADLKKAKVKVFEMPSRNENMIISIIPNEKFSGEMIPADLLGTLVYVGWPHLVEAKVVAISNSKRKYICMGGPNEYNVEERTGHLAQQFKQEVESITDHYQKRLGIETGEVKVLVHVQVMIGRKYVFSPNGRLTLEKQFATNTSNYPIQTVVFNISAFDDHRSVFRNIQDVFPKECTCFTLTNPYYGSQGTIQDSKESLKHGRLKICITVLEEPDFSSVNEVHNRVMKNYKPLHYAASQLSVSNFLFSRVTGSIFINTNNEGYLKNVNIGLDLKLNKKNKETPGYTKKIGNTWYYSDKSVDLVRHYSETYPEVFDFLCRDDSTEDVGPEKIFNEESEEKLRELQNWLKTLPTNNIEKQTCGGSILEPEVVEQVEKVVDKSLKNPVKTVTMQIKPSFLYRPEIQNGTLVPDPKMETKIFDRIVNVRDSYTVPLGLKGTVIGIHESPSGCDRDVLYDVVFDKPFKDGMTLNCSENRGYKLPKTAFINISYGKRLLVEKTGKPEELIAKAEAPKNTYNNYYQGPNYFGQLLPPHYTQQQHPWMPYMAQQQQNQQPLRMESSAFAQFSSITGQRMPYPYQNPEQMDSQNVYTPPVKKTYVKKTFDEQQRPDHQKTLTSNINNGLTSRGPPSVPKDNNYFMPSFSKKSNPLENKQTHQQQQTQKQTAPENKAPDTSDISLKDDNKQRHGVNTDFLKQILKVGSQTNKRIPQTGDHRAAGLPGRENATQKPESSNISFDVLAQAANAPATVRLLTYYQSNGLGLPRYQYFSCGNFIQSQVKLPSGELIAGKPAATRVEASENVAADILEIFLKNTNSNSSKAQVVEGFPAPPRTWVQPEVDNTVALIKGLANKPDPNQKLNNRKSNNINKTRTDATVLNNSFVPLQAIKNHISKASNSTNRQNDGSSMKENVIGGQNLMNVSGGDNINGQMGQNASKQIISPKPRKERKMRIAANFKKD